MSNSESPIVIIRRVLETASLNESVILRESADFFDEASAADQAAEFARLYDQSMSEMDDAFDETETAIAEEFGPPTFTGRKQAGNLPRWAQTGHRVTYWNVEDRIIYLHITQIDKKMPFELTLGVVQGPPDDWFIGV